MNRSTTEDTRTAKERSCFSRHWTSVSTVSSVVVRFGRNLRRDMSLFRAFVFSWLHFRRLDGKLLPFTRRLIHG